MLLNNPMQRSAHLRYDDPTRGGFIEVICDAPVSCSKITLTCLDEKGDSRRFETECDDQFKGRFCFNSYYVDDGDYQLIAEIQNGDNGSPVTILNEKITIENGDSDLAQKLRVAFQARSHGALQAKDLDSSYFDGFSAELSDSNYPQRSRSSQAKLRRLTPQQIGAYDRQGFLPLPGFFDKKITNACREYLETINNNETHGFKRGSSDRIVNLHKTSDTIAAIYNSEKLYDVISDLMGCQAHPCQSLTFINGSMQDAHQDTIHLTPFPRGLMCGIWIALEDVQPGSGELFFYPRSHQLPAVLCKTHGVPKVDPEVGDYSAFGTVYTPAINSLLTDNPNLQPHKFMAKAGDVLIWQENLIHGGAMRTNTDQTRMSMVIHAFGEPALIYYDSTGMSGRRESKGQRPQKRSRLERIKRRLFAMR